MKRRQGVRWRLAAVVVVVALGGLATLGVARFGHRPPRPTTPDSSAPGPIPGPPEALAQHHLAKVTHEADAPDVMLSMPGHFMPARAGTLIVSFTPDATVADANRALRESGVLANKALLNMLVVQVPSDDLRDVVPLFKARAALARHDRVQLVSLDLAPDGVGAAVEAARIDPQLLPLACGWASTMIMQKYGVPALINHGSAACYDQTEIINGKKLHWGKVVFSPTSWMVAVVEGTTLFPLEARAADATSPHNVLGLSAQELETQDSQRLTGKTHWLNRTRRGRVWLARTESHLEDPWKRVGVLQPHEEYAKSLEQLRAAMAPCTEMALNKDPGAAGAIVVLTYKLHPDGNVSGIQSEWTVDFGDKGVRDEAAACLREVLAQTRFSTSPWEDVLEMTEVVGLYPR